ncbi:hypothetical protein BJ741DRAFT_615838 [Chytriomyces cf. hyalinus JEL632]|nr:hypothetical protein BJ741DRAFT_615838 [Chytriomyces cf. hyalinus JEL632]
MTSKHGFQHKQSHQRHRLFFADVLALTLPVAICVKGAVSQPDSAQAARRDRKVQKPQQCQKVFFKKIGDPLQNNQVHCKHYPGCKTMGLGFFRRFCWHS